MKKIIFYTNQFFGQIGGEDKANMPPAYNRGAVGTANLFGNQLDGGEIVGTIVCGDNYYVENIEKCREFILEHIEKEKPQLVIAGPAFNAGRFGIACGDICAVIEEKCKVSTVTGMYNENPAVEMYKDKTYIIETGKSAASMKRAVSQMLKLANKSLRGEEVGLPSEEGYISKGIRRNVFKEKTGAERAVDMLVAKLKGEPYLTEVPIPTYQEITPANPILEMPKAKIALITSGGVVPEGNPDHLPAATAKFYKKYDIANLDALKEGDYESVHAGYDPVYGNKNPNRIVPLDLLRQLEREGSIGSIYPYFITTTGNSTSVADATRMGQEIAEELRTNNVDGVILTST